MLYITTTITNYDVIKYLRVQRINARPNMIGWTSMENFEAVQTVFLAAKEIDDGGFQGLSRFP